MGGQNATFDPFVQQFSNPLLQQLNNNGHIPLMAMAQQQQLLSGMQFQQNGLDGLGGMGSTPVGNFASVGGNLNLGNLGGGNINNNFLQHLIAQQARSQGQGGVAESGIVRNKRTLDGAVEEGGPTKKTSV